jgi:hypothetical protein
MQQIKTPFRDALLREEHETRVRDMFPLCATCSTPGNPKKVDQMIDRGYDWSPGSDGAQVFEAQCHGASEITRLLPIDIIQFETIGGGIAFQKTYPAEIRCIFCDCLLGEKEGFHKPDQVTSSVGECCQEFAMEWMKRRGR